MVVSLGLYEYTKDVLPKSMFVYTSTVMMLIASFSWLLPLGMSLGLAIIVLVISGLWFEDRRRDVSVNTIRTLETMVNEIDPKPENFHYCVNAIDFFYNIQDLKSYNPDAYKNAVLAMDRLLGLYEDLTKKAKGCKDLLSLAEIERDQVINHIHSLIYSIDIQLKDKYHKSLTTINVILRRIIEDIEHQCELNEPGTVDETIYQEPKNIPRSFDPDINDKDPFYVY